MASRSGTSINSFCRLALALAVFVAAGIFIPAKAANAGPVVFSGTVPPHGKGAAPQWPQTIVSFADQVALPVAGSGADRLRVMREGGAPAPFELLRHKRGRVFAVVDLGRAEIQRFTICAAGAGCMRYEVLAAR